MNDDDVRRRFDGSSRVELLPGRSGTAARIRQIEAIGHALGYRLLATENAAFYGIRLVFERDEAPDARRRRERAIARLRTGGPVLPPLSEGPPPPPPLPPPAAAPPARTPRPRAGGLPAGPPPPPPPPPPAAAPHRRRIPPMPLVPPPPPPPPGPPVTGS